MLLTELKKWLEGNIAEAKELEEIIGAEDIPYFEKCLEFVGSQLKIEDQIKTAIAHGDYAEAGKKIMEKYETAIKNLGDR